MDDDVDLDSLAPACPGDGFPMSATVAGWRCPVCGLAALPLAA